MSAAGFEAVRLRYVSTKDLLSPRDVIAIFDVDPWGSTSSRVPCTPTLSTSAGTFLCSYLNRGICIRFLSTMKHWRECKMMGDNSFLSSSWEAAHSLSRYWGGEFGDPLSFNPDRFSPEASGASIDWNSHSHVKFRINQMIHLDSLGLKMDWTTRSSKFSIHWICWYNPLVDSN